MQDHFAIRDKTGTVRLSGREVLIVGWLVCLGKREFPVDPHRDPRAEKSGAETVEQSIPTGVEIPQQTRFHSIESPRKAALSNLHTHEVTGSSPAVSTIKLHPKRCRCEKPGGSEPHPIC